MKIQTHPTYPYVTIVSFLKTELEKVDLDLCAQPRQTLSKYYNACTIKPTILCNGGFFSMSDGSTMFNYKNEGEQISTSPYATEGMGTINGALIFGKSTCPSFTDFISAYPVLIKDSQKVNITYAQEINYKARRTILGYNADTIFLIAIESPGMDFAQMQDMLIELGVAYAINLDGGGSTKILYNGESITSTMYNRAVDNVVAFYLKPTIIYRVQTGSFSLKANADKFCEKIRALPNKIGAGYSKAYVRKVNGTYKVQVGAFSVKSNAQKVVSDLKSLGYSCFITTL